MIGVLEIPNLLSPQECGEALKYMGGLQRQKNNSYIIRDKIICGIYSDILLPRLPKSVLTDSGEMMINDFSDSVTVFLSNKPIEKHKDQQLGKGNLLKLFVYLNDVSEGGGTIFGDFIVKPQLGKGVIFDITKEHSGELFPIEETKITIGFRLLCSKV